MSAIMIARALVAALALLGPIIGAAVTPAPPRIEIEGKSDGSGTISTGLGLTIPWGLTDLTPRLTYEVSSAGGLGTLLSIQDSAGATRATTPRPWTAGVTLTLRWWGPLPKEIPPQELKDALGMAYDTCVAQCRDLTRVDDEGKFCARRRVFVEREVKQWLDESIESLKAPLDYCQDQRKDIEALEQAVAEGVVAPDAARARRRQALAACMAPCAPDSILGKDKRTFCALREGLPHEVAPSVIGADRFCRAGLAIVQDLQKRHPETISHQRRLLVNLGAQGGGATFKHLAPDPTQSGQLAATKTNTQSWAFGASGAWLFASGGPTVTLEALAVRSFDYTGADDKARYCLPAGDVTAPGGGTVPAITCVDLDAAAPVGTHNTRGTLLIGWFDQVENTWRLSAGAEFARSGNGRWQKTIEAPIHFSVAGSDSYKGLVRVVPYVTFGGDPKAGTVYAVSIALLGQRGFFSERFDRL